MRHEKKYKIEELHLNIVLQAIRLHPAGFKKIFPDRCVNNIYFDTPSLTTYHHNVAGISTRNKFRVRWYSDDIFDIRKAQFEIKAKENQLGSKTVIPVADFSLNDLTTITHTVNQISGVYAPLRPVLINSYRRSYFGTSNQHFRVTVDRQLNYASMLTTSKFVRYNIEDAAVVLEIKYDESLDNAIDPIMQYFPFRQTKSSKYVTGVQLST